MKKTIAALFLVTGVAGGLQAQNRGEFGAGLVVGDPTGVTAKYWMSRVDAVAFIIGLRDDFAVSADYMVHSWTIFPRPASGKLGGYLGAGAGFRDLSDDNVFGIRALAGASYILQDYPVEIFAEVVPILRLAPDTEGDLDMGVGVRYYFNAHR